jgi:hypothetical protein
MSNRDAKHDKWLWDCLRRELCEKLDATICS